MTLNFRKRLILIGFSLFIALFVVSVFLCNSNIAYADETSTEDLGYIYAENPTTIYTNEDPAVGSSTIPVYDSADEIIKGDKGIPAFYVPYTYFLKVVAFSESTNIYTVKYMDLDRLYVPEDKLIKYKNGVEDGKYEPKQYNLGNYSPYPNPIDTVLTLKDETENVTIKEQLCDNTYTFTYIGSTIEKDKVTETDVTYFYVKAEKESSIVYGKVLKESFNDFELKCNDYAKVEWHPEIIPVLPPTSSALRIVLIVGIAVPAVIIMIIIFLPRKKETVNEYEFMKSKKHDDIDYDRDRRSDYRDDNYDDRNRDINYDKRPKFDDRDNNR